MFIDLDNFKQVNDLYGHDAGDEVLIEVSNRIIKVTEPSDRLVRIGGDEFILIKPGKSDREKINQTAQNIINTLSDWSDSTYQINVSASVGIAEYTTECKDIKVLLKKADNALYEVKRQGKRGFIHA
ncbi:GGDEF domain-containing protein [Gracilibacillus oryzae]|nr:GGDEF domain-containing protein [Gracilibacillus oryzae]